MKEIFIKYYNEYIKRDGADKLLEWLSGTDFFTSPASTRYHGAVVGGLCAHSINVFLNLIKLTKTYPEIVVSKETVALTSLLHDVCKIGCYKIEMRNVKENGVWVQKPAYTFQEDFAYGGHGSKSVFLISKFIELTDEEAVAINCHMGAFDRVPGDSSLSAAFEKYPFAFLLHAADMAATYIDENQNNLAEKERN